MGLHLSLVFLAGTAFWIKKAQEEELVFKAENVFLAETAQPQEPPGNPSAGLPPPPGQWSGATSSAPAVPALDVVTSAQSTIDFGNTLPALPQGQLLKMQSTLDRMNRTGVFGRARDWGPVGDGGGVDGSLATSVEFDAYYILLTYEFLEGQDLDTQSTIMDVRSLAEHGSAGGVNLPLPLGFICQSGSEQPLGNPYFYWGGDNRGVGFESVYIDVKRMAQIYPNLEEFTIDCRAHWYEYGVSSPKPVSVRATLFKEGTMQLNGFCFYNQNFQSEAVIGARPKVIRGKGGPTQRIALLVYNVRSKQARFEENGSGTMKWLP